MRYLSDAPLLLQRRHFLFAAATAVTVPLAGPVQALPAVTTPARPGRCEALGAVTDRCLAQAQAFLEETGRRQLRLFDYIGDPSSTWFDQIAPALRESSLPLVGLTSVGALFCIERLAWDLGRRVVYRAEHALDAQSVQHVAFGAAALEQALRSRPRWRDCTHAEASPDGLQGALALATWVLAPLNTL